MVQLFGFGKQTAPTPAHVMPAPTSFAEDDAGFSYFSSDQHHRHLAAAICRYLTDGRSFILVTGNADGDLIADAVNRGNQTAYRASVVQCHPDMDLGKLVRAYSAELGLGASGASKRIVVQAGSAGLKAEPESGGIWTLLSYLTAERQSGVTRMLLLKDADFLGPHCFDDLQRLALLDEQHIMPVILMSNAAERGALAPFDVLQSPMVGRLAVDHLEQDEVGAFIQAQLDALSSAEEMGVLFPPRIVEAIAVASGGNAAVVNRLARKVLVAFSNRAPAPTPTEEPPDGVGNTNAPEGCQNAKAASNLRLDQKGAAFGDAPQGSANVDAPATVAAETSHGSTVEDIEPTTGAGPIAEVALADAGGLASFTDQGIAVEAGHILTKSQSFEIRDCGPSAISTGDEQRAASEIRFVKFPLGAEEGRSEPTPVEASRTTPPAFESARGFVDESLPNIGSPTTLVAAETVVVEATAVDTVGVDPRAHSTEHTGTPDVAPAGGVDERPAKRQSSVGLKLAVPAIVASVAALIILYSSGLGQRQELAEVPSESSRRPVLQPEARVVLPPTKTPQASKTIAERPLPNGPAPTASSAARSKPTQNDAPVHSTSAAAEPVRQSSNVMAAAPQTVPSARLPPSMPHASGASLSQLPNPRVADQSKPPEAQSPPESRVTDTNAIMVQRGEQLLAAGDIISARRFFERVTATGNAAAAYGLAETYDPLFLKEIGARGVLGQSATAVIWYQRAVAAGSAMAAVRLRQLQPAILSRSLPDNGVEK